MLQVNEHNDSLDKTLDFIKKEWRRLMQFGSWVATLITSILISPSLYEFDDFDWYWRFLDFFAAAISSVLFFLVLKFAEKKYAVRWWLASLFFLILSATNIVVYTNTHFDFTTPYANTFTVVGNDSNFLDSAKTKVNKLNYLYQRQLSIKEIVQKSGGNTESLWDADYLNKRRKILILEFAITFLFITPFIISITQAIKLQSKTTDKK